MDIVLKSGEKLYEFPTAVAQALIYLGFATKIEKHEPALAPVAASFTVGRPGTSQTPCIIMHQCRAEYFYSGKPEGADAFFAPWKVSVPDSVVAEYKRQLALPRIKGPVPELSAMQRGI